MEVQRDDVIGKRPVCFPFGIWIHTQLYYISQLRHDVNIINYCAPSQKVRMQLKKKKRFKNNFLSSSFDCYVYNLFKYHFNPPGSLHNNLSRGFFFSSIYRLIFPPFWLYDMCNFYYYVCCYRFLFSLSLSPLDYSLTHLVLWYYSQF